MSRSAIAIHTTPAAVITHTVATIRGQQLASRPERLPRPHSRRTNRTPVAAPDAPLSLGLVVAALLIVAETLLLYPLTRVASAGILGAVYLLGVLIVAIGWGFWLAAAK